MKKHLLSLLLAWAPLITAMNVDDDNGIQIQLDESPSTSSSSSSTSQRSPNSPSSTMSPLKPIQFLDQTDRAIALTLEEEVTDDTIIESIEALKGEEDMLERNIKKLRKEKKSPAEIDKTRLSALQVALGAVRVNWAERILKRASHEDLKKNTLFDVTIQTCIEELQIFISHRARIVNEPYRMRQERELRIREISEEIEKREATKKQLETEHTIWRTLIENTVKHREKEKALVPPATIPSGIDTILRDLAQTLHGNQKPYGRSTDNTRVKLAETLLPKKREIFAQISVLLAACKKIDAQFLPVDYFDQDDDDDDAPTDSTPDKELDAYYSSLSTILQAAIEQVPLRQTDGFFENVRDSQIQYLRLLLSEQLAAESTAAALSSLLSANAETIRNREIVLRMLEAEKDHYMGQYEHLHTELESQKVLLCKLKKLAGEELNPYEKERLKKAERIAASVEKN